MVNLLDYLVMKYPTHLVFALLDSVIPTYVLCVQFLCYCFFIILRTYVRTYMHVLYCAYSVWCLQCVVPTVCGAYSVWCLQCVVPTVCGAYSVWCLQCAVPTHVRTCIRMVLKPNWHTNTHSC